MNTSRETTATLTTYPWTDAAGEELKVWTANGVEVASVTDYRDGEPAEVVVAEGWVLDGDTCTDTRDWDAIDAQDAAEQAVREAHAEQTGSAL